MGAWTEDELRRIDAAEELGSRRWGATARCAPGARSGSCVPAMASTYPRTGREVENADAAVLDQVDAAYREKYGRQYASIVDTINDTDHRATTLRMIPRT